VNAQSSARANWTLIQLNQTTCNTIAMAYSIFSLFHFTQIIFNKFIPNISNHLVDYELWVACSCIPSNGDFDVSTP
jgi:hypothetical protein